MFVGEIHCKGCGQACGYGVDCGAIADNGPGIARVFAGALSKPLPLIGVRRELVQCGAHDDVRPSESAGPTATDGRRPSSSSPPRSGGEEGDPRAARGRRGGSWASLDAHPLWCTHHLTSPLLRNGSLPLPRGAAERTSESSGRPGKTCFFRGGGESLDSWTPGFRCRFHQHRTRPRAVDGRGRVGAQHSSSSPPLHGGEDRRGGPTTEMGA